MRANRWFPTCMVMDPEGRAAGGGANPPSRPQGRTDDPQPDIDEARRRIAEAQADAREELDLGGLNLRELPEELFAVTAVTRLRLPGNRLTALDPRVCTRLDRLTILDLASNRLDALPPEIGALQSLQALMLGVNKLASLPDELGNIQTHLLQFLSIF
jgi:Leucine-rich repeat (LRR) protein